MKIEKDTVVTLRYKVTDLQGKLIEEAKEPMMAATTTRCPRSRRRWTARKPATASRCSSSPKTPSACAIRRWSAPSTRATSRRA